MKIETYLNAHAATYAYVAAAETWTFNDGTLVNPWLYAKRERQRDAFRARILRTVAIYRNFAEANGFDEKQAWFWTDEWQAAEKEVDKE